MTLLYFILPALLAGLVQGLTGFGSGIILMIFLPALMPVAQAAGVAGMTMFVATAWLAWRYRKALQLRQLIVPFIVYSAVATVSVPLGQLLDTGVLKRLLGGLLLVIAAYFTLRKSAIHPYP